MVKKKTLYSSLAIGLLMLFVMPCAMAALVTGNGISPAIGVGTEDFPPLVWMCDHRIVYDDATSPGRISPDGTLMVEREYNYAFEGEQVEWRVLAMDKNGLDDINDVFGTFEAATGGALRQVNCVKDLSVVNGTALESSCNARIGEEHLTVFNPEVMAYYTCTLTVETVTSMNGPYWLTVEADDDNAGVDPGIMAEKEYWYLNPTISIGVDGDLAFSDARPGTDSYSDSILLYNDAPEGSGVMMDMFISGTDFYDSSLSGSAARCPTTNQLLLNAFRYYATNGAYSSSQDARADAEGYIPIKYGIGFNDPNPFYNNNELLQVNPIAPYYVANTLSPGAHMAVTFKLSLPEPCNGNFDSGSIFFWAEAI